MFLTAYTRSREILNVSPQERHSSEKGERQEHDESFLDRIVCVASGYLRHVQGTE